LLQSEQPTQILVENEPEKAQATPVTSLEVELPTPVERENPSPIPSQAPDLDKTVLETENDRVTELISDPEKESLPTDIHLRYEASDEEELPLELEGLNTKASNPIALEPTIVLNRPIRKKLGKWDKIRAGAIAILLGMAAYDLFLEEEQNKSQIKEELIRVQAHFPAVREGTPDFEGSKQALQQALKHYVKDTVSSYAKAVQYLHRSIRLDPTNVRAKAILASAYLNLIDSSTKDETYFSTITKLIELSKSSGIDLTETVIADVEFLTMNHRTDAALSRIIEYTRGRQNFDPSLFYYLSWAFFQKGDFKSAATYLAQLPENQYFSAKVFYLRALIQEALNERAAARESLKRALQLNPQHIRSRIKILEFSLSEGALGTQKENIETLLKLRREMTSIELARVYYFAGQWSQLRHEWDDAISYYERAAKLEKDDPSILLELYTVRGKRGEKIESAKQEARMYFYLSQGERLLKEGKVHEALTSFIDARGADLQSPIPLVKMGDMFHRLNNQVHALMNYKLALERRPNSIEIGSKYIRALILNYEWAEAQKEMDRFRKMTVSQSAIDKAAGDMYSKMGKHVEAQVFYKKAMARETVDAEVYISYAKSLLQTKGASQGPRDAPFFFALALRYDPLSSEAIIGTARALSETESIDSAIRYLQEQLIKWPAAKTELLVALAEFYLKKADYLTCMRYINQAKALDPDAASPYRIQGQLDLAREGIDKDALSNALDSFRYYSERNQSDPVGYLERYRIYVRRGEFDKAGDELNQIYAVYPKYPNLGFYKGSLYSVMGNHKLAAEEFQKELKTNNRNYAVWMALGKEQVEIGLLGEAIASFNQAMQLEPKNSEPRHWAGWANYLTKNYTAAVVLLQGAIQLDPGNPILYKRLGLAYRDSGDPGNARAAFRKYLEREPDAQDKGEFAQYL
jgi:tetratricopeptide (TPR) repeat protein